jgi:hypothetical protein
VSLDAVAINLPQSAKTSPSPEIAPGSLKKRVKSSPRTITKAITAPARRLRVSCTRRAARRAVSP